MKDLILEKKAKVAVIGLGYVGLPLLIKCADQAFPTIGLDTNSEKIESLKQGKSPISTIQDLDLEVLKGTHLTTEWEDLHDADIILICVPTDLHFNVPDTSNVDQVLFNLRNVKTKEFLVVIESTVYPGYTAEADRTIGELLPEVYSRMHLGFSPERIDPGNSTYHLSTIPKIVSAFGEASLDLISTFYLQIVDDTIPCLNPTAAEFTKLFENCYRVVNIAYVNEMTKLANSIGLSMKEIADMAETKPFGFTRFNPSVGVGGHCLPVNPYYMFHALSSPNDAPLLREAVSINEKMPEYFFDRIRNLLNHHYRSIRGSAILILGTSYKKDVNDFRNSPALILVDKLIQEGADVTCYDPYLPKDNQELLNTMEAYRLHVPELTPEIIEQSDLVVIATNHSAFQDILEDHPTAKLVIDSEYL